MKLNLKIYGTLAGALLVGAAFFLFSNFLKGQTIARAEVLGLIGEMSMLDRELDDEILQSSFYLRQNNGRITELQRQIAGKLELLTRQRHFQNRLEHPGTLKLIAEFGQRAEAKEAAITLFQAENAAVKNALTSIPTLITQHTDTLQNAGMGYFRLISAVAAEVSLARSGEDDATYEKLEGHAAALGKWKFADPALTSFHQPFRAHVDTFVRHFPAYLDAQRDIVNSGTADTLRRMATTFAEEDGRVLVFMNRLSYLFLFAFLFTTAMIVYYISRAERENVKLHRLRQELSIARDNLEVKVRERTADLVAANDALVQAKENAENATVLKDKFVSLVAHDLRAPFNSIIGMLRIHLNDKRNPLTPEQRKPVERAIESSEGLVTMIDELLNLSRIQTGTLKPKMRFLDGKGLVSSSLVDFEEIARSKGITLENAIRNPARIYADGDLFSEVLRNLISNAIKFTPEGGKVTVFMPEDRPCTIAVRDNGIGMTPERLNKIFNFEEKLSSPGTMGEKGSGIGLALCREIAEAHGGSLTAASDPGSGSIFYASLPVIRPRVLLADDEYASRDVTRLYLEPLDAIVMEAADGMEAKQILEEEPVHLLITDIRMPKLDGYGLIRFLRQHPTLRTMPVIVLTARRDIESREALIEAGANDFVPKPIEEADFIPRIRRFIH